MTKKTDFNFQFEYEVIENELRRKIADDVDLAFEAYVKAGYPLDGYPQAQYYLNFLFQSVNQIEPHSEKRIGALQLIDRFMLRLIDEYNTRK